MILEDVFYLASSPSKKLRTFGYLKYPLLTGNISNTMIFVYLGPNYTCVPRLPIRRIY